MTVLNKIEKGREYRDLSLIVLDVEDERKIVEGYATTFGEIYELYTFVDELGEHRVYEQVDRDAFNDTDMSDVIFQYDHEGRVFARQSNGTMNLETDDHGLKVTADLGGTSIGRQLYEEIKGGYTDKMSFGFTVSADDIKANGSDFVRTILKIGKLYDVSAVSIPANNYTEISARKQCDGAIAELEAERLREARAAEVLKEKRENLLARLCELRKESHGN